MADAAGDINLLINDMAVFRATATFLRTAVTRDTPWDRFLAGSDHALTKAQQRGARLFFTAADQGGAGCYSCHSGPMLNKQPNDPDVSGAGAFIEENFYNLGLADHPLQALNRAGRNDPDFRDDGRKEITGRDSDAFKFRVMTLRQLKDARFFFHNGAFTRVKDVVRYFNDGVPQDAQAAAAGTLTTRFTHPRGTGSPRGLGLSEDQVEDLSDFLENGLYDPAFVKHDPKSPTRTLQLNVRDFTYSKYRPDLVAAGAGTDKPAVDGRPLSGLPQDNNDALSRRDMGLEFLDVTAQAQVSLISSERRGHRALRSYRITNNSTSIVDTHLLVIARGLGGSARLENASGTTRSGDPYLRVFLPNGVLMPGQSIVTTLEFSDRERGAGDRNDRGHQDQPLSYSLVLLSGQGKP